MSKPSSDPWTVALHVDKKDHQPIGAGVVVDSRHVLTCAHVARWGGTKLAEIWIAFPKAPEVPWGERRVARCVHDGFAGDQNVDLALLELEEPVPGGVTPARLRCLPSNGLEGKPWWSFGFPDGSGENGRPAYGQIGDPLGYGLMHLNRDPKYKLAHGFSGGPVWSPDYEAVVGIVVKAAGSNDDQAGDGQALTLSHADTALPEMKLSTLAEWRAEAVGDDAMAAWGWRLAGDNEARRHWVPRARGVASESETGHRFRGRERALSHIVNWLDRPDAAGWPLVVTGSPGVGKSAVLGRVVTTADRDIAARLPGDDAAVRATVGSVACAVHAKGRTALEVAAEIARAAAVPLPRAPGEIVAGLRRWLSQRPRRFNVIIDALDEVAAPEHARELIHAVLVPLARSCADVGVQVTVGTRRADDLGDLLKEFGSELDLVDLDSPAYFSEPDLAAYAEATLRLIGAERTGNPYATSAVAAPVARRIAQLANGNFLVAGLVARTRALRDSEAVVPGSVSFTATVDSALDEYLVALPSAGAASARTVLTALAYAEMPGLPSSLWQAAVEALGASVTRNDLAAFARTSAANFLVETQVGAEPTYRLFHQALTDSLLDADRSTRTTGELRILSAWTRLGAASGWAEVPAYLLQALPKHAERLGMIDMLLADEGFLLHADLNRLVPTVHSAVEPAGQARARLLRRTPLAVAAEPAARAAMFSVVDRIDRLGTGVGAEGPVPYRAVWADTPPRPEHMVMEGHTAAVNDVCTVTVDDARLLASASEDGTVRLWDPRTGEATRVIDCHADNVRAVCELRVGVASAGGRSLEVRLATASDDRTVRIWDPYGGEQLRALTGHHDWVRAVCAVSTSAGEILVSAGDDRTVRSWDPATGQAIRTMSGHTGWVTALCPVGSLVASAGYDGRIRLWDPRTGQLAGELGTGHGWITALLPLTVDGVSLIASTGYDGVVRLWDPASGLEVRRLRTGHGLLTALCVIDVDGGQVIAATTETGTIRLWDAPTGRRRNSLGLALTQDTRAVCAVSPHGRDLLATAGVDGRIRTWDPRTGNTAGVMTAARAVPALRVVRPGGLLASGGEDGIVRLTGAATGAHRETLDIHSAVTALCPVTVDDQTLLAVASRRRAIKLWDVATGQTRSMLKHHPFAVNALCAIEIDGRDLLVTAADDHAVRLCDPSNGQIQRVLRGHHEWVTALAAASRHGRPVLASSDKTGVVRLWDADGDELWERRGHHDVVSDLCCLRSGDVDLVVSAGADHTIRLWACGDGEPRGVLRGHAAAVTGVCMMPFTSGPVVVSTSLDGTVRLWDPATGRMLRAVPVHHEALACEFVDGVLVVGLDRGMLALTFDDPR